MPASAPPACPPLRQSRDRSPAPPSFRSTAGTSVALPHLPSRTAAPRRAICENDQEAAQWGAQQARSRPRETSRSYGCAGEQPVGLREGRGPAASGAGQRRAAASLAVPEG